MGRKALIVAAGVAVLLAIIMIMSDVHPLRATRPTPYHAVDQTEFATVSVAPSYRAVILDFAGNTPHRLSPRSPGSKLRAKTESTVQTTNQMARTGSSIAGKASWYCKAGVSICHHSYPPGSMVAAACGKLRAAMGPNWRGRIVTVTAGSRSVVIKLVDYCASRDKLIDLYWAVMVKLGGSGVLSVRVSW
jgi:hypothetical protein